MKKVLIISSFVLVLIAISTVGYQLVSASVQIDEEKDIITAQTDKEAYLTPYGYTLENPNVVMDPYDVSPLTAIILFETDEYLPVTITVQGKDKNSTYTNNFESAKKHYIPVYGLYPNTTNIIHIECGNYSKTIEIKTEPLPIDLNPVTVTNNTNKLTFITTDTYPYAIDNNNEVRWYLTKHYSKKINCLENGNLLLSSEPINSQTSTDLVEIDLLGKIYKQYTINDNYLESYTETPTGIYILSNKLLKIDKQTGIITDTIDLEEQYNQVDYDKQNNTLNVVNKKQTLKINLDTKEQTTITDTNLINEQQKLLPIYNSSENHQLTKGIKLNNTKTTEQSNKNIFLIGYKEPDKTYKSYNIEFIKTTDNIEINGNFKETDKVYLILDKFLDKRIYNIDTTKTIINKEGLNGKYSIYISINGVIYKTNKYIKF